MAGSYTKLYNKKVSEGKTLELTATVNDGYNFEGWYIDGICVSRALNYTHTMEKKNVNISVNYSCYKLSTIGHTKNSYGELEAGFNAGSYTQYSNEKLSVGKTVTLTATVNDGYNFEGWYIEDVCVSTDLEYTFTMGKEDTTLVALYSYYTLKTSALYRVYGYGFYNDYRFDNPALCISPYYSDGRKISIGTSVTVTAVEVSGYTFCGWETTDGVLLTTNKEYTFAMTAGDVDIHALYIKE